MPDACEVPFTTFRGPTAGPLVLAVPHAGRHYPEALLAGSRLPVDTLMRLEDRLVDRLIAPAVDGGATAVVATVARAWIDLNRDPREVDPTMLDGPLPGAAALATTKVRGGLGLIPRRVGRAEILGDRLSAAAPGARVAAVHAPYHKAIAAALDEAVGRHGCAVLLDLHSMPPLRAGSGAAPLLVVGDLFGRSADPAFTAAVRAAAGGLAVAHNRPYAGGHALAVHGRPERNVHAVQVELCRSLYLDDDLLRPGDGWARTERLVAAIAARLAEVALGAPDLLAAE